MIYDRLDLRGVEDPVLAPGLQVGNGYGCGYLMAHDDIQTEHLGSGERFVHQMAGKYFFSGCLPHLNYVPFNS